MTDRVCIDGLELDTVIGVYDWERTVRQQLLLDLEMAWPVATAAATDEVAQALDYAAVSKRLRDLAAGSRAQLLETLAEQLAAALREEFRVSWVRLRLSKPGAVPSARSVGVQIERGARPAR